jgi:FkbM family methyltransferase
MTLQRGVLRLANVMPNPMTNLVRHGSGGSRLLRPLVNRLLPGSPTPITVRSGPLQGMRLVIDPQCEKFYWTGTWEPAVQSAMCSILRPGMSFWDVGAHIGFFSMLASRLVGEQGQVQAFEPMPDNRKRLIEAVRLNGAGNITVHDAALARFVGTALLHRNDSSTMWSLVPARGESSGIGVRCLTLDDVALVHGHPDLIKIDVEGADVDVIRGGGQLLKSRRSSLIVELLDATALDQAKGLLPTYRFQRLDQKNWLLQ